MEELLNETALLQRELLKPFSSRKNASDVNTYGIRAAKFLAWIEDDVDPKIFKLTTGEDCRFYDNENQPGKGFDTLAQATKQLVDTRELVHGFDRIKFTVFVQNEGSREITVKDLQKTADFGSSQETTVGSTVDMESMTAIFCALMCTSLKEDITLQNSIELIKNNLNIVQEHLRGVKVSNYLPNLDEILNSNTDWSVSFFSTAISLKEYLGPEVIVHRQSSEVKAFAKTFNNISNNRYSNINKWNPADIWLLKGTGFPYASSLEELNREMSQRFEDKTLVGVSLKKVDSTVRPEEIKPEQDYDVLNILSGNIRDGHWVDSPGSEKLIFPGTMYMFRCFNVAERTATGFSAELSIGRGAYRDGKAGLPAINYELKKYEGRVDTLPKISEFMQQVSKEEGAEYERYVQRFGKDIEITGQSISKHYAMRVKEAYEILSDQEKISFLSGISAYALSRTSDSCPHLKVY